MRQSIKGFKNNTKFFNINQIMLVKISLLLTINRSKLKDWIIQINKLDAMIIDNICMHMPNTL
jgi:hypothetical protein